MFRNGSSFHQVFVRVEKDVSAQSPGTPTDTVRDAVRARCGILLRRNELVELGMINGPVDIDRGVLNISQHFFVLAMSWSFCTGLEDGSPIFTEPSH